MLELAEPGEAALAVGGMDLVAFEVAPETRALYTDRLTRAGVPLEGSTDFTLYVRDPEDRALVLSGAARLRAPRPGHSIEKSAASDPWSLPPKPPFGSSR